MNSLERSLACKAGYDNGWEISSEDNVAGSVKLSSALHRSEAMVSSAAPGNERTVTLAGSRMIEELSRAVNVRTIARGQFVVSSDRELAELLRHAARLARTLPDLPCERFEKALAQQLPLVSGTTAATEIERLVRQRVGQEVFRASLVDYWSGACSVLGVTEPALLRASHTKPWAECASDEERLNVFNGFLLSAHLDALFDRHLMTFDPDGTAVFVPRVTAKMREKLGLTGAVRLRWVSPEHEPFLQVHRARWESQRAFG